MIINRKVLYALQDRSKLSSCRISFLHLFIPLLLSLFLLPWFCNMYDAFILFFVRIVLTLPICWFAINVNGKCFQVHEWFGSLDGAVGIWVNILWMINTQQLILKYESWVFLVYIFAYNSWHMDMVLFQDDFFKCYILSF